MRMNEERPVGVVIFDSPGESQEGWAAFEGGDAFRIQNIGELDTAGVWIGNIDYNSARKAGLERSAVKQTDFLGSKLAQLAGELGVNMQTVPSRAAEILAEVAGRTVRLARRSDFDEPGDHRSLAEAAKSKMPADPRSHGSDSVDRAISDAYLVYHSCDGRPEQGSTFVPLRWDRITQANLMTTRQIPRGDWSPLTGLSEYPDYEELLDAGSEYPLLLQVDIAGIEDSLLSPLLGLGSHPGPGGTMRRWAPFHEIAQRVALGARVRVRSAFAAESYTTLRELWGYEDFPGVPDYVDGSIAHLSVAAGLVAENIWLAAASPQFHKGTKTFSARAVYMRAWDRLICLKGAQAFAEQGFHVTGYGKGNVHVAVPGHALDEMFEVADPLQMVAQTVTRRELLLSDGGG